MRYGAHNTGGMPRRPNRARGESPGRTRRGIRGPGGPRRRARICAGGICGARRSGIAQRGPHTHTRRERRAFRDGRRARPRRGRRRPAPARAARSPASPQLYARKTRARRPPAGRGGTTGRAWGARSARPGAPRGPSLGRAGSFWGRFPRPARATARGRRRSKRRAGRRNPGAGGQTHDAAGRRRAPVPAFAGRRAGPDSFRSGIAPAFPAADAPGAVVQTGARVRPQTGGGTAFGTMRLGGVHVTLPGLAAPRTPGNAPPPAARAARRHWRRRRKRPRGAARRRRRAAPREANAGTLGNGSIMPLGPRPRRGSGGGARCRPATGPLPDAPETRTENGPRRTAVRAEAAV